VVNVDGVTHISDHFIKTGEVLMIRKNMNPNTQVCDGKVETKGVDLNRNYAVSWDKPGGNSPDPCAENYRGTEPFSEPETRAIRDFLVSHKDEIKFVYNFHAFGNMYLWPYNGQSPNNIAEKNQDTLKIFDEIWNESTFPEHTLKGNAWEALRYISSGEQSDWILGELGIPSICPELGSSNFFSYDFIIPYRKVLIQVLEENINWLEHTYDKIGMEIEVKSMGYDITPEGLYSLQFLITNKGLSDTLNPGWPIIIDGLRWDVDGIKKRSSAIHSLELPYLPSGEVELMYFKYATDYGIDNTI